MKKILLAAAAASALMLAGCDEQGAKLAIEAYGFKDVVLTGTPFFGCSGHSDSVFYNESFTAVGPTGIRIRGVACGAMFKGYTVRITGPA